MMRLALFEETLQGGAVVLPRAVHGVYLRHGSVTLDGMTLAPDSATMVKGAATLAGTGEVWRFEVSDVPALASPEEYARMILAHPVSRDPVAPFVLRMDRVDFPPEGATPRHGHAGPGIRRLLSGRLLAEVGEEAHRIDPGVAWFETGTDPVVGRVMAPGSAFIRCMVLDAELLGRPTFRACDAAEATKPRSASSRLFFDTLTALDAA
jgi:quercetin dioxygenase-like cupin family protein